MSKIWEPLRIDVYQEWVSAILNEASDELTDWETNFIESIDQRLGREQNLTESQAKTLEKIYAGKTK